MNSAMSGNILNSATSRTPEERAAVQSALQAQGGEWLTPTPDYMTFDRKTSLEKADGVYKVVFHETDADRKKLEAAYDVTREFIHGAFDFYEGKRTLGRKVARAFVVPMRSDRHNEDYASESIPFVPLFDPDEFGVNSNIRMRAMYGYPPTVLDTYLKSDADNETGALVLAPVYDDMKADLRPDRNNIDQTIQLMMVGGHALRATANFAHVTLGAKTIGLGAILPQPAITNYGAALRSMDGMEDLETTTGHGGTVYMIVETAKKILEETSIESEGKIGIIGAAGSIGWSSAVASTEMIEGHDLYVYDRNVDAMYSKLRSRTAENSSMIIAGSALDVLRNTNIIISAITGRIDLDKEDPDHELDLHGKVIIDDSQPGCFDSEQVAARGGKLVWVVGEDGSDSQFMTRDGLYTGGVGYNYGDKSGLYGRASEFACGQEAAVIAKYAAYGDAIKGPVTPDGVRAIGRLFLDAGVRVAPFQAFGQSVSIG